MIGVVGGIGSGKSTVARAFERLGCVVSDSDAEARAVLERPDVAADLLSWWGTGVFGPDGRVNRSAVAQIIFADERERRRLEARVHPLLHESRQKLIGQAQGRGVAGVVIDAPLLLEAGIDRECDALVFVHARQELREARVAAGRGWSPGELHRREATQMPLEQKKAVCRYVVNNEEGDAASIDRQVGEIWRQLQAVLGGGGGRTSAGL